MRRLLLIGCLLACAEERPAARDAAPRTDAPSEAAVEDMRTAPWTLRFQDDFANAMGPPWVEGYAALPAALFSEARWGQVQNTHPGENDLRIVPGETVPGEMAPGETPHLSCLALGRAGEEASKADVGRFGFAFAAGATVRLTARLRLSGPGPFPDNTLLDLEDTDDLLLDGESPGAGLRIRTDAAGRLALDRGEVPGLDEAGAERVLRLSTLRSERVLPTDTWFVLEVTLRLGADVPRSREPLATFDGATSAAWVEARVNGELVLRMEGTNLFSRDAVESVLAREAPEITVTWTDDVIDYDVLQVGATNNRSGTDRVVDLDWVRVEERVPAAP